MFQTTENLKNIAGAIEKIAEYLDIEVDEKIAVKQKEKEIKLSDVTEKIASVIENTEDISEAVEKLGNSDPDVLELFEKVVENKKIESLGAPGEKIAASENESLQNAADKFAEFCVS